MEKLYGCGVDGDMVQVISSLYKDNKRFVRINNEALI